MEQVRIFCGIKENYLHYHSYFGCLEGSTFLSVRSYLDIYQFEVQIMFLHCVCCAS